MTDVPRSTNLLPLDDEIDLVLTAFACQEHVLLVGPPGCGKSLLLDSVMRWMTGKRFSILLTKFTSAEKVFGPVSLKGLKEDRFVRVTIARLPEADLVFADEIFKASSAILIRLVAEDEQTMRFQLNAQHRDDDRFEYTLETLLTLAKKTGKVTCDLTGLEQRF